MRVYLEQGKTWTFACAVDWPGWQRRGKGDEAALDELMSYAGRYAALMPGFRPPKKLDVIGTLPGNVTTDFGAPDVRGPWDDEPCDAGLLADQLEACWVAIDQAIATVSAQLQKGPRGGGRDRDKMALHVQEAERSYGRAIGVKVPPRTPWPEQRAAIGEAIRAGAPDARWPLRYAVRRCAWHVLDHAWEMEDKDLS